jgi:hypothetical protein
MPVFVLFLPFRAFLLAICLREPKFNELLG